MNRKTKVTIAGAVAVAAALAGALGANAAAGGDDSDVPIPGTDLERAKDTALSHLGEGHVTETEVGDEESYYEVEVRLPDGRQVDVQLDEEFAVVSADGDGAGDDS